ncbi:MAG: PTS transporter subunit IIC [Mediterraneibacter gnavus]
MQFATLVLLKSPVLVICGFVPVFFDNATIGVFVNEKGGLKSNIDPSVYFRSLPEYLVQRSLQDGLEWLHTADT